MSATWVQDVLAALLAAGALAWLIRRQMRARRRVSACENCPSARPLEGVRPPPVPNALLSIDDPGDPRHVGR